MEERSVDRDTVERTKGKLMQKASERRQEREAGREGGDGAVAKARRSFEENRRLQGVD
jgi:hypothetical protein